MYNKEKQWIISFTYVKTLTYLAIWLPGGPLFINNVHVRYRSNLIRTFCVKVQNMIKTK